MDTKSTVRPEREPTVSVEAQKEAVGFEQRNLDRRRIILENIHIAGLVVFWLFISVGTVFFLIWAWHLIAPDKWRFLNVEERNDLQMVILSAVSSSFATEISRRWLNPPKN